MTRKEITDYCCERLIENGNLADTRAAYYRCERKAASYGYSERVFADIWYNALLWYRAVWCRSDDREAS